MYLDTKARNGRNCTTTGTSGVKKAQWHLESPVASCVIAFAGELKRELNHKENRTRLIMN